MRLIDADKLKEVIHCAYSDDLEIIEKIDSRPTVFDKEKVVKQLEIRKSKARSLQEENMSEYFEGKADAFEIVKGGRIE